MYEVAHLVSLILPLCFTLAVTAQFFFQDPPLCTNPFSTCVLFSRCLDEQVFYNQICDFRENIPMICCLSVKNQSTTPSSSSASDSSTPAYSTTSNAPAKDVLPQDCGKSSSMFFNRIVGGDPIQAEVFPWLVVLYIDENAECGGSFIAGKWVLTAAHCVYLDSAARMILSPDRIKVRKGATNLTSLATFYSVSEVLPHPGFTGTYKYANDVALVKLTREVKFDATVRPICLPGSTTDQGDPTRQDMTDRMAFLAGWGKTNQDNRKASDIILQTQVLVWSDSDCLDVYGKIFPITNTSFCAGRKEGGKDACQGDSGGPLMLPGLDERQDRFYAVGLVSFGQGCGQPGYPGGYTKTKLYRSWIEKKISSRS